MRIVQNVAHVLLIFSLKCMLNIMANYLTILSHMCVVLSATIKYTYRNCRCYIITQLNS